MCNAVSIITRSGLVEKEKHLNFRCFMKTDKFMRLLWTVSACMCDYSDNFLTQQTQFGESCYMNIVRQEANIFLNVMPLIPTWRLCELWRWECN